jgi:hypothetical protein
MRTRNGRKIKKGRISLPYHKEMEIKRNEDLKYKVKFKIARRQRHNAFLVWTSVRIFAKKLSKEWR